MVDKKNTQVTGTAVALNKFETRLTNAIRIKLTLPAKSIILRKFCLNHSTKEVFSIVLNGRNDKAWW